MIETPAEIRARWSIEDGPSLITTRKIKAGSYEVIVRSTKQKIGEVHMTGTHLDDYPWEWGFEQDAPGYQNLSVTFGVSDLKAGAVQRMTDLYRQAQS
jgi:hypothetical protein